MSAINFEELSKHIPADGALLLTVKRVGTVIQKPGEEADDEGDEEGKTAAQTSAQSVTNNLVVSAVLRPVKGKDKTLMLNGSPEELTEHFFTFLAKQTEKLSILDQMAAAERKVDDEISKAEKTARDKQNKLKTAQAKAAAPGGKPDTQKPASATTPPKPEAKPEKPTAKVVPPIDMGSLFGAVADPAPVLSETKPEPVAVAAAETSPSDPTAIAVAAASATASSN